MLWQIFFFLKFDEKSVDCQQKCFRTRQFWWSIRIWVQEALVKSKIFYIVCNLVGVFWYLTLSIHNNLKDTNEDKEIFLWLIHMFPCQYYQSYLCSKEHFPPLKKRIDSLPHIDIYCEIPKVFKSPKVNLFWCCLLINPECISHTSLILMFFPKFLKNIFLASSTLSHNFSSFL